MRHVIVRHNQMRVRIDRIIRQAVDLHNLTDILVDRTVMRFVHMLFCDRPQGIAVRHDNALVIFVGFL